MSEPEASELLIHNGRIHTMDARSTVAEAVLVRGGRVAAVGTRAEVAPKASARAASLDLEGAYAVPGLIDTHPHLLHFGALEHPLVRLWDCRTQAEIVGRLAEAASRTAAGEWIQGTPIGEPHFFFRRSYRDLAEGALPDRRLLDRASREHPIVIQAWAPVRPNCMAFNSLALQRLGITRDTPDRVGNVWIDKDATGEPTGLVTGSVTNYYANDDFGARLWREIPFLQPDSLLPGTAAAIEGAHRQGVTAIYENHMMESFLLDTYRHLRSEGQLRMRVVLAQEAESYGMPFSEPREWERFNQRLEEAAAAIELEDPLLRFDGMTMAWDGYCFGGGQMMRTPYLDVYGSLSRGKRHITPEKAERVVRFCAQRRIRLNLLVMGTAAHDEVLQLVERVAREVSPEVDVASLGWVLVHATTIEPAQIQRYRRLGFCCTTSMAFCWGEGEVIRRSMGARVTEDLIPLRRLLDAGMAVGGSTDWGPKNPWEQLQLSLTHEFGESGRRNDGPAQRITRLEALAMLTRGAAKVLRWDDIGSIQPGHHADLAIVDRDPLGCPVEDLGGTRVLRTFFGGEQVFPLPGGQR